MQPKSLTAHPTEGSGCARSEAMTPCVPGTGATATADAASLALRHAQRAFAALVDANAGAPELRAARLKREARRTLSALSADDRSRLGDWLALQLATIAQSVGAVALELVVAIDARLGARVGRALPRCVEALANRVGPSHIVAA
jgi:hypothetical protein